MRITCLVTSALGRELEEARRDASDIFGEGRVRQRSLYAPIEIRGLTADEADFAYELFTSQHVGPYALYNVRQVITELAVTTSVHGQPCIEVRGASPALLALLKKASLSSKLKCREDAIPFVLGESAETGWMLVEFWGYDYQSFVEHLNHLLRIRNSAQDEDPWLKEKLLSNVLLRRVAAHSS